MSWHATVLDSFYSVRLIHDQANVNKNDTGYRYNQIKILMLYILTYTLRIHIIRVEVTT